MNMNNARPRSTDRTEISQNIKGIHVRTLTVGPIFRYAILLQLTDTISELSKNAYIYKTI